MYFVTIKNEKIVSKSYIQGFSEEWLNSNQKIITEEIYRKIKGTPADYFEDETGNIVDVEIVEVDTLPPEPTEIELLQEKIAMQDAAIEELMFVILPELTGGGI